MPIFRSKSRKEAINAENAKRTFVEADAKIRRGRKPSTNARITGRSYLLTSTEHSELLSRDFPNRKSNND
jgi:hypothetical protein